jgi:hypothetical protein
MRFFIRIVRRSLRNGSTRLAVAFVALTLLAACNDDDPTVWRKNVPSPDGAWVATARTDQWGGFGSAYIETTVSLRKVDGTVNGGKPFDVFDYPSDGPLPKPYVLSDENADPDLRLIWLGSSHLKIEHPTEIIPDLEVARYSNVDISFK